jgi:ATP-dependent RNA helicase DOB1
MARFRSQGRIAADIQAGDEVLLTELLLNGHLASLTSAQLAALLSCFVFQEKSSEASKQLPDELLGPLRTLQEEARKVARVMQDCNLEVNVEAYVQSFRPHLMEVAILSHLPSD